MFKLIIAGSRSIKDYRIVEKAVKQLPIEDEYEIVSGHANGVDKLGERYAREYNINLIIFPADWDKYGKSAGYKRNEEMAQYADGLLAIWDGESKGTRHMLNLAKQYGLRIWIKKC